MKKIIISLIVVLTTMTAFAQDQAKSDSVASPANVVVYRLFPTTNMWTFIKLNTRTGQMWQVQWSQEAANRAIIPIE